MTAEAIGEDVLVCPKCPGSTWSFFVPEFGAFCPSCGTNGIPYAPIAPLHTKPAESAESVESGGWKGFGFLTFGELEGLSIPPVEWLAPGLIPANGITLLAGPPKSCKTFLAIAVAASVSAAFCTDSVELHSVSPANSALSAFSAGGRRFTVNRRGTVLYLTPDDPNLGRFRNRLQAVTEGSEQPAHLHVSTAQTPGIGATFADRLTAELERRKSAESAENPPVRLVVIDTLQRVKAAGSGSDRYADDVNAMAQLRRVSVAHPDVAILVLHHSRKVDPKHHGDPLELVSGSQGIAGGVDQLLILQVPSDRGPARALHVIGRDGEDHKLALTMTGNGLVQVDEDPDDPARLMSEATARVYRALREFSNGARVAEIAEIVAAPAKATAEKLGRLAESGHAIRVERGVYRAAEWTGDAR